MEWQIILALVIAIPVILFPVAFIWFINIGGIWAAIKQAREKNAARKKKSGIPRETPQGPEREFLLNDALERRLLNK
jgi:hypothetical protein